MGTTTLEPGESTSGILIYTVVTDDLSGPLTNTATITYIPSYSGTFYPPLTGIAEAVISPYEPVITALAATNDSPTELEHETWLAITTAVDSNVALTWAFGDGEIGSGAIVTHTYADAGIYTATVTASNPVSVLTATTTITVQGMVETDLAISKSFIGALGNITYTIVATNLGPDPADGAVVYDEVAAHIVDVAWTCVALNGATCAASGSGNTISETLTSFPAGGVVTFTVTADMADIFGDESNLATIIAPANVTDLDETNNSSLVGRPYKVILPVILQGGGSAPRIRVRPIR